MPQLSTWYVAFVVSFIGRNGGAMRHVKGVLPVLIRLRLGCWSFKDCFSRYSFVEETFRKPLEGIGCTIIAFGSPNTGTVCFVDVLVGHALDVLGAGWWDHEGQWSKRSKKIFHCRESFPLLIIDLRWLNLWGLDVSRAEKTVSVNFSSPRIRPKAY